MSKSSKRWTRYLVTMREVDGGRRLEDAHTRRREGKERIETRRGEVFRATYLYRDSPVSGRAQGLGDGGQSLWGLRIEARPSWEEWNVVAIAWGGYSDPRVDRENVCI